MGEVIVDDPGGDELFEELPQIESLGGVRIGELSGFIEPDFDAFGIPWGSFHHVGGTRDAEACSFAVETKTTTATVRPWPCIGQTRATSRVGSPR